MTKRQHPCTKRKSHKTYSVTKTKIESTLIITFFCGVKTKFCLAKQQKSKSCHLCHGCGATIYKAYFSGFNAIFQKWFFVKINVLAPAIFWSMKSLKSDQKVTGAKKFILTKNQFYYACQPRKGIFELHSCCGLIFMTVFGNFDRLVLTH